MANKRPIKRNKFWQRRLRSACLLVIGCAIYGVLVTYLDANLHNSAWLTGYTLGAAVIVLAAFHLRKKIPCLPILGSASGWMQFHIYLGLATFVFFGWHIRWRMPGGPLELVLATSFLLTGFSGVYGLLISRLTPRKLAAIPRQFIYEQIPLLKYELRARARRLVFECATPNEILARFYVNRAAKFFEDYRGWRFAIAPTGATCKQIVAEIVALDRYLSPVQRETTRQLMALVREKDDLDYHQVLQGKLKIWLIIHIVLTYCLLTVGVFHAVLVHAFSGGLR